MTSIDDQRFKIDPVTGERKRTAYSGEKPWRARYRDPGGKSRSKSFKRKVDAQKFLDETEVNISRGGYVDPRRGRRSVADWYDQWAPTRVDLRPSTLARDEANMRNHILPRWSATPLARVDNMAVRAWVVELSSKGLSAATVLKIHQQFSRMLRDAVGAGLIVKNPCDGTPLPKIEPVEQRFLDVSEVARLIDATDKRHQTLVATFAYCGLRASEALGLRVGNVDLLNGRLRVVEQLVEVRGSFQFGPPKTRAGRRSVPIPRSLCDEIAVLIDGRDADELVFTSQQGRPIRLSLWRERVFHPAVRAANLRRLRVHDLRHTAVALWIAAGASPKEIAARAGHASVASILDTYGHLLPETELAVTDRLDEMLRSSATNLGNAQVIELRDEVRRGRR